MNEDPRKGIIDQIEENKKIFLKYNSIKKNNLYQSLTNPQMEDIFNLIPLLLHVNLPELPGYVNSPGLPSGIFGYQPSPETLSHVRSKYPSFIMPKPAAGPKFIQMFSLMGSGGTIAFTDQSDFDFWICFEKKSHKEEAIKTFKSKCRLIEEWFASSFGMQIHFFLNDISDVKNNIFDEDEEGILADISLGQLLKEEFFRSSILIAGKIPFWWVIPSNSPDDLYETWQSSIAGTSKSEEFIDLGNLHTIAKGDFLIAALFQLLKSLGNPFKSIIKLGLVERYLNDISGNPFISNSIKESVHRGTLDLKHTDAYAIMFDQVFRYFSSVYKDSTILDIINISFYLKVDPHLSTFKGDKANDFASRKVALMREFVEQWGWAPSTIAENDDFNNWDIMSVNKVLTNTKKFILKEYKEILQRFQAYKSDIKLSGEALRGISNRVFSYFLPEENKVDNTLSFKNYPPEKTLSIGYIKDTGGKDSWILYKKIIMKKYASEVIIRKEKSLFSLIVWISLNGFFKKEYTRFEIEIGLFPIDKIFIQELITELSTNFQFKKLVLQSRYFLQNSFPVIGYVIINFYSKYAKKIDDIIFLYHNSWGETRFDSYKNETDLAQITLQAINSGLTTGLDFNSSLKVVSSNPYGRSKSFARIKNFLEDSYTFFTDTKSGAKKRYITMLGNAFHVFTSTRKGKDETINFTTSTSELRMLYSISYNRGLETRIKIDSSIHELNYLKVIFENFKEEAVQIYYQLETKYCYFFISDERGSLIFIRKSAGLFYRYLARLYLFAEHSVRKVTENNPSSSLAHQGKNIELYQLKREIWHDCTITEINPETDKQILSAKSEAVPFKLSIHLLKNGQFGYRFTLPDGGYSEILNRMDLENVIEEIRVLMENVRGYSYFATDIELAHSGLALYKNYTSLAFSEKNRFEMMIEKGMKQNG